MRIAPVECTRAVDDDRVYSTAILSHADIEVVGSGTEPFHHRVIDARDGARLLAEGAAALPRVGEIGIGALMTS